MVIQFDGDWTMLKDMSNMQHVDLSGIEGKNYYEKMTSIYTIVMQALKDSQSEGVDYVMFIHGYSSSEPFIGTARSIVRSIMSSKEATPFINKKKSIQHSSVFIAAIKPKI